MVTLTDTFPLGSCRASRISVGALSASGGILTISGPDRLVEVWNVDAGERVATWRLRAQPARLETSHDGGQFTAYCIDGYRGTVDHWHGTVPGSVARVIPRSDPNSMWAARAHSTSGRVKAIATPGTGIRIERFGRIPAHLHTIAAPSTIAVSRFGGLVAAGDERGHTAVWATAGRYPIHQATWAGERILAASIQTAISGSHLLAITVSTATGQVSVRRTPLRVAAPCEAAGLIADLWHRAQPTLADWVRDAIKQARSPRTRQAQLVRELVEARTNMVDALETLDPATRERTRDAIDASAQSLYTIQLRAWSRWLRELALENPLTMACALVSALFTVFSVKNLVTGTATTLSARLDRLAHNLTTSEQQFAAVAVFLATSTALIAAGRGWRILRGARNITRLLAIVAMTRTVGIAVTVPPSVATTVRHYAHVHPPPPWHQSLPYPVWLGLIGALYATALGTGAKWVLRRLRQTRTHQLAVGDALIPALVGIAYNLRRAADDPKLTGDSAMRVQIVDQIQLAARLAEREWVYAHRTGHRIADDTTSFQGYAIAHAIRRRTRDVTLGGPALARAADAFAIAVANAAQGDWIALGDDPANLPPIRRTRRTRILANVAAILLPVLGALLVLRFSFGHPAAANSTAGILVSIAAAHLISLLRLNEDFDTGNKIAAAFRGEHQ
jgi:hypothetical protein